MDFLQYVVPIIEAINNPLGLSVLMVIVLCFLAYVFFGDDPGKLQLWAFGLVSLVCLAMFGTLVFFGDRLEAFASFGGPVPPDWDPKSGNIGCVMVTGLDEQSGDGFLAVRASHSVGSEMLDKVYNGEMLFLHERDENWQHIKLLRDEHKIDGWVFRGYTEGVSCP